MDNRLEEKWDMLDEKEQRMIVSYMNNFLSAAERERTLSESNLINLDDSPARKRMSQPSRMITVEAKHEPVYEEAETLPPQEAPAPVAEAHHQEANPAALGLLGFGMTTVLLNLHNAGLFELSVVILAMGIALGGLAQIIAGLMEFKNNNTFGATAFTAYGLFWWSLVIILVNPEALGGLAASHMALGAYMLCWCVFTGFMYIGTLKMPVAQRVVFGSLTILFFLLAVENFSGQAALAVIAGYVGIFCGVAALYTSFGTVLNEVYGRKVMPL